MAVRIHAHQLDHAERVLAGSRDGARTAAMRAINRAMQAAKTEAIRKAGEQYTIKQSQVREKIRTSQARKDALVARVTSRGYALRLTDYQVKPGKPQPKKRPEVMVNVLRSTGFRPVKGAFVAKGKASGRLGVFIRQSKARLPISQLYGPSIPQILGAKRVSDAIEFRAQQMLNQRFEHEINRLLMQRMGAGK